MPDNGAKRERVVILGGGVGAVAAAFALTDPDTNPRAKNYDVTIYQIGWRLGGKGASSRNHPKGDRIEEHGLHIWFGFYANALAMMAKCYADLRDPKDTFDKAFTDHSYVVLEDQRKDGSWVRFPLVFPKGDNKHESADAGDLLEALIKWLQNDIRHRLGGLLDAFNPFGKLAGILPKLGKGPTDDLKDLLAEVKRTRDHLRANQSLPDTLRWARMAWDIGWAIVHGMLKDDLVRQGFHTIDDQDLWQWLKKNGAEDTHELSVMVRGLYTQAFAFQDASETTRNMAAGASLRAALRMTLMYKGAFMRKMNAGMGDIVFAPFYRVLKARGVRFKFFHRVRELHLDPNDPKAIGKITLGRQVTLKQGTVDPSAPPTCCPGEPEYQPLAAPVPDPRSGVRHVWPLEPDQSQIDPADAAKMQQMKADPTKYFNLESVWTSWGPSHEKDCVLERGTHFDKVVLAISIGALDHICKELVAKSTEWEKMLETTATVRTQAAQLWLDPDLHGLGWHAAEPVHGAYAFPMDSWASMSQTIPAEQFPPGLLPGSIAYFCGVLPHGQDKDPDWFTDPDFPKRQHAKVRATMKNHLQKNIAHMWPNAVDANGFRWDLLIDLANGTGEQRLDGQHIIANVDPTERYVLSVPESMQYRLPADASGFTNLFLAGDWTRNAVNLGCVEAAVSSGMVASRGISGHPQKIVGDSDP